MSETRKTLIAWCEWKTAECDREATLSEAVGMPKAAEPFARDAKFFRAIVTELSAVFQQDNQQQENP